MQNFHCYRGFVIAIESFAFHRPSGPAACTHATAISPPSALQRSVRPPGSSVSVLLQRMVGATACARAGRHCRPRCHSYPCKAHGWPANATRRSRSRTQPDKRAGRRLTTERMVCEREHVNRWEFGAF
jgi:hypothetical protein